MDTSLTRGRNPVWRMFVAAIAAMNLLASLSEGKAELAVSSPGDYRARVVEIYGDKAIVEIDGRRFLIEPVEPDKPFPADVGSEIQIVGRGRGNVLVPSRITLPSGISIRRPGAGAGEPSGIGDDSSIEGQLRKQGITVAGRPFRRRNYTVVEGRAQDGRRVIAIFDSGLRLEEIEEAERRFVHPRSPEALPETEVVRLLAERGYSSIRLIDQSRFQFLYAVMDAQGQRMELYVGRDGSILRRVWLR